MEHYIQVWEANYGERDEFLRTLDIINEFDKDIITGMNIWWSDIPYSLALFVQLAIDASHTGAQEVQLRANTLLSDSGAILRSDITLEELEQAAAQRQINMQGAVQGFKITDPCAIASRAELREKGYDFRDWTAKKRVFLSHQSERKEQVLKLQALLAGYDIATWMDIHDIDYGENLATAIDRGVANSSSVIFWISDDFLRSNWCRFEFEGFLPRYASSSAVKILSVVEDGCEQRIPSRLKGLKYLKISLGTDPREIARELAPTLREPAVDPKRSQYWAS